MKRRNTKRIPKNENNSSEILLRFGDFEIGTKGAYDAGGIFVEKLD